MAMRRTRVGAFVAAGAAVAVLAGCAGGGNGSDGDGASDDAIKVAAFEGGYGAALYQDAVAAYESANPGVDIELTVSKTIAQELTPQVAAGDYPDLVILGLGGPDGFTESFVRDKTLEPLSDVLDMTIPGEDVTVGDKPTPGIVGNLSTNPYGDDDVYLMPMNASPTGLVYNKALFEQKGWAVPTTWDEMTALGATAAADGISLFTYPTAGYLDGYFFTMAATVGGDSFYQDVATFQENVWESDDAKEVFDLTGELLSYAAPTTVGYANAQDFTRNQQTILDGTALFMPNGTWISNEMKDAPRTDGFTWGLSPVPAVEAGGDRFVNTSVESAWIPAEASKKEEAKKFLAYLYSDEAADIFAESGAVQPIAGITERLTGDAAEFYSVYDGDNVNALVGAWAATTPVPGVDIKATLYNTADSFLNGEVTLDQWRESVSEASNRLTGQLAG